MNQSWWRSAVVALVVLSVDQVTKSIAVTSLGNHDVTLIAFIKLILVYNQGIAFGVAAGFAPILVGVALLLILAVLIRQRTQLSTVAYIAIGLVIGGALGNVADRTFRGRGGAVVDFISVWRWPVFNLADAAVVIGAFTLALTGARRTEAEASDDG